MSISLKRIVKVVAAMGIVASMGSKVMAQADPYDPSSPNYIGNSVNVPKYNASISASARRGLDEFAEESAYYEAVVGMNINKNLAANVTAGYSHPFDFDAERTDRWELEDVELTVINPSYWKSDSKSKNLSVLAVLSIPTSGTSQDAGLYSSLAVGGIYSYRRNRLTFSATSAVSASLYEFETSDEDGFKKNTPLAVSLSGSAKWGITSKLALVGTAGIASLFDYDFNNYNVQTVTGAVQYSVNRKLSLSLTGRWRDRVITNNSRFDDDASKISLNLVYSI